VLQNVFSHADIPDEVKANWMPKVRIIVLDLWLRNTGWG